MARVERSMQICHLTLALSQKEADTGSESTTKRMVQFMKVSRTKEGIGEEESCTSQMVTSSWASSTRTRNTELAYLKSTMAIRSSASGLATPK